MQSLRSFSDYLAIISWTRCTIVPPSLHKNAFFYVSTAVTGPRGGEVLHGEDGRAGRHGRGLRLAVSP